MTGSTNRLTGGCQCGALRYEWLEKPTHSSVCYCRMCQKASGQPFMGLTGGERENLRWTRGMLSIFKSSNMVERGFCRDCGTPLTYSFVSAGHISVAINSLDDPEAMPPTRQFDIESKVSWVDGIHTLRAAKADDWLKAKGVTFVSNQHPDKPDSFGPDTCCRCCRARAHVFRAVSLRNLPLKGRASVFGHPSTRSGAGGGGTAAAEKLMSSDPK